MLLLPASARASDNSQDHGIIESLMLERTSKIIKSNHHPNTPTPAKPRPEVPHLHVFQTPRKPSRPPHPACLEGPGTTRYPGLAPLLKDGPDEPLSAELGSVWGLNLPREGHSPASLGNLCQGSVTLRGKKFFLSFSWNFPGFSLCPLPLVLSLSTTGKSLAPSS